MALDLSRCTEAQRDSIKCVDGPLLMCAGAGSGKTFTLQQRIAYALTSVDAPDITSINDILAITFTKKAAEEIKNRVRGALLECGLRDQALLVDDARVSTIHSACKRILREHALEIGVDPELELLDDVDEEAFLKRAFASVIARVRREGDGRFDALIMEYGLMPSSPYDKGSLYTMVKTLIKKTGMMTDGFDSLKVGTADPLSGLEVLQELLSRYGCVLESYERAGSGENKFLGKYPEYLEVIDDASRRILDCLETGYADNPLDEPSDLLEFIARLPQLSFGRRKASALLLDINEYLQEVSLVSCFAHSMPLTHDLIEFARQTSDEFEALKAKECKVDQDGLLKLTLTALKDNPAIADDYRSMLKLVMVDEFQDTNQLQVDLVRCLCGEDLSTLCTVGDSQQSIYRFRNADVNVYAAHKEEMRGEKVGATYTELNENFRSHGDILSYVRRVCGAEGYFIEPFFDLNPARDEQKFHYKGVDPRVSMQMIAPQGNKTGEARKYEAKGLANWFGRMNREGHSFGDMVVLVGSTTGVEIYEEVFRSEGIPCIITGGSSFCGRPEVLLVRDLLKALSNPADTKSLYAVLSGEMFALSADDLVLLATKFYDDDRLQPGRCAMDKWLVEGLPETSSMRLRFVADALVRAWSSLGECPISRIALNFIEDSGWLTRLAEDGPEGRAVAANVIKSLRIVESIEEQVDLGAPRVAEHFAELLACEDHREKMGALMGGDAGLVRIMTAHSSKGLEFPIVAVANCYDIKAERHQLDISSLDSSLYLTLVPGNHPEWGKAKERMNKGLDREEDLVFGDRVVEAVREAELAYKLKAAAHVYERREEYLEKKRLFYVATTRASEALMITMLKKSSYEFDVRGDIGSALFEGGFPDFSCRVDYGGGDALNYVYLDIKKGVPEEYEPPECVKARRGEYAYPELRERKRLNVVSARAKKSNLISYSAMAEDDEGLKSAMRARPSRRRLRADEATEFGSAFHQIGRMSILQGASEAYESVDRIASTYGISDQQGLYDSTIRWLRSDVYADMCNYVTRIPELSFCVPLENSNCAGEASEVLYLDGDMDVFCEDGRGEALVVDYKTGGEPNELPDILVRKHLLQAQCYAYAVLSQGFERVRLAFVRVEHPDWNDANQPQIVAYEFNCSCIEDLRRAILAANREEDDVNGRAD